jgi:GNAT superfamily N-acetyltransferase
VAVVTVTYLQMFSRASIHPKACADPEFIVREAKVKQWRFNQFLYALIGSDWDWTDKLEWSESDWRNYAEAPHLQTYVGYHGGTPAGYFELRHQDGEVEIVYFGLAPGFIGIGLGGYFLTRALDAAWDLNPTRVWLHTCSKDHASALPNYVARGLEVYKEEHIPL